MRALRVVDPEKVYIDYHLNLLGIRVTKEYCQLISRGEGEWDTLGSKCPLPVQFPKTSELSEVAAADTLRVTAWQFERAFPNSDLRALLSQALDFDTALRG